MAITIRMNYLTARCRLFLRQLKLCGVRKLVVAILGGSVVLVGIAMLVLPGPAILVIPLGLAILATEFLWAKRWLKRARALLQKSNKQTPTPAPPVISAPGCRDRSCDTAEPKATENYETRTPNQNQRPPRRSSRQIP